jgi:hypothetical protein
MVNIQLALPPVYVTKTVAELAKECLGAIVVECLDRLPLDQGRVLLLPTFLFLRGNKIKSISKTVQI